MEVNDEGNLQITTYAREHMDECCLAFNLKVKHKTRYSEQFYQECVLYRDVNTDLHFEAHFSESSNADVMSRARIIAQANAELIEVKKKLPMVCFLSKFMDLSNMFLIAVEEVMLSTVFVNLHQVVCLTL